MTIIHISLIRQSYTCPGNIILSYDLFGIAASFLADTMLCLSGRSIILSVCLAPTFQVTVIMSAELIRLSHERIPCVKSLEHLLDQELVYTSEDITAYALSFWNLRTGMKNSQEQSMVNEPTGPIRQ